MTASAICLIALMPLRRHTVRSRRCGGTTNKATRQCGQRATRIECIAFIYGEKVETTCKSHSMVSDLVPRRGRTAGPQAVVEAQSFETGMQLALGAFAMLCR